MNLKRIKLLLPFFFCAISLLVSAQYQPKKTKFVFGYGINTLTDDHSWTKSNYLSGRLHVDLSHPDTIFFWMDQSKHYFTKLSTEEFANEPLNITSFHLLGIFKNPVDLPGIFILIYLDEEKGILRKYFFSPNHLMFCDYSAFTSSNPFSRITWPQSVNDTIKIRETINAN